VKLAEREQRVLAKDLRDVAPGLSSTLELDKVLAEILVGVRRVVQHEVASIRLLEGDTARLVHARGNSHDNSNAPSLGKSRLLADVPVYSRVRERGQPVAIPDTQAHPDRSIFPEMHSVRSCVCTPIRADEQVIGFLDLGSATPDAFSPAHARRLQAFADQVAIAIKNAQRFSELQARNRELGAFAHTVAHDLKSPLASLLGFCSILDGDLEELGPALDEQREFVGIMSAAAREMVDIVDAFLLLASVRHVDEVKVERLDMGRIAGDVQQRLAHMIEEHGAEMTVPDTWPDALGFAPWVEAIWVNYLSNAIKYGGQPPCVDLGADAPQNGDVRFWVHDNGNGLTPAEQARLFTPVTRLERIGSDGHGLGLSIVQRIVDKLGGEVGVESSPGEGSTFWFTLPVA
jgi:signal transduction histidine kinase